MGKVDFMPLFSGKVRHRLTGVLLAGNPPYWKSCQERMEAISTDQLAGEILASDKQVANLLLGRWGKRFSMSGESLTKADS